MLHSVSLSCLVVVCLLGSCQAKQQAATRLPAPPHLPAAPLPAAAPVVAARPALNEPSLKESQTLYPDTLHPRPVAAQRWTTAEVDTMPGRWLPVADARYRVLDVQGTPAGEDGPYLRLFCRTPGAVAQWLELDLRNPLGEFQTDLYLEPQAVELDRRPPAELLVRLGGRNDGNASGTGVGYTLLLSLAGPPTVIWQSVDDYQLTIRPLLTAADTTAENAFTSGYQEREVHRRVTVRGGRVQVARISQEADGFDAEQLTPITPGSYWYQGGRFQRARTSTP